MFWRVGVVQLAAVALLSLVLGAIFSHGFFEAWGWIVGPALWLLCAWFTARFVRVDVTMALTGAVLAGVVSAIAVLFGQHWLGALVAVGLFAAWCAREPREGTASS